MNNVNRELTDIIDNEALAYAMYTIENRAIPNMIDGFKPVHRFMIYRALEMSKGNKDKFHKLASVAGGVADAGYHHGENSAQEAGALMANTWNNNFPFLDGQGNFGTRLVQQAAASRYIFCRISDNFRKVYKDAEIAPAHEDVEHLPPKFYLPVIPTVLLNGVSGIATGYSTKILPHCMQSVIASTMAALAKEEINEPEVKFPEFSGEIRLVEKGKYELHGVYEVKTPAQIYISDVPPQFDRAKYVEKVLDPLEDAGLISYDDDCSKTGFGFKVKFRKDYKLPADPFEADEKIKRDFKLIERVSQNIVVIDEAGKLREFDSCAPLIEQFVKVRLEFINQRIGFMVKKYDAAFKLAIAKAIFIKEVNANNIVIKGKTKAALKEELSSTSVFVGFEDQLVSMNIYHMTDDEVETLKTRAKEAKAQLDYWMGTTAEVEYLNDLKELASI